MNCNKQICHNCIETFKVDKMSIYCLNCCKWWCFKCHSDFNDELGTFHIPHTEGKNGEMIVSNKKYCDNCEH